MVRSILLSLVAVVVLFGSGCAPRPDRHSKIGRLHRAYVDTRRTNWQGDGPRPISVTVWYPASSGAREADWGADVFRFGRNALDAPFADPSRRYPLVVVSHGTGGSAAQLSWLAESLADAGFIVAGVNHHGNTAAEDVQSPAGFVLPEERARDLSAVIDDLLADRQLARHIDPARIGAAGFSLGGYTVLASVGAHLTFADWQERCKRQARSPACMLPPEAHFSMQTVRDLMATSAAVRAGMMRGQQPAADPRIRAVYAIGPALVTLLDRRNLSAIRVPVKVVVGELDQQVDMASTASAIGRALPAAEVMRVPYARHYSFLAECSLRGKLFVGRLCRDSFRLDRTELHDRIAKDAAQFFAMRLER